MSHEQLMDQGVCRVMVLPPGKPLLTDSDMCDDRPFVPWEGCAACWSNDDHRNILLCDGCDLEFHHYCVVPPLPDIPSGARCAPAINILQNT